MIYISSRGSKSGLAYASVWILLQGKTHNECKSHGPFVSVAGKLNLRLGTRDVVMGLEPIMFPERIITLGISLRRSHTSSILFARVVAV